MMTLIFFFVAMILGFQVILAIAIHTVDESVIGLYNLIRVKSDEILGVEVDEE